LLAVRWRLAQEPSAVMFSYNEKRFTTEAPESRYHLML
jgi:hypothetical protein